MVSASYSLPCGAQAEAFDGLLWRDVSVNWVDASEEIKRVVDQGDLIGSLPHQPAPNQPVRDFSEETQPRRNERRGAILMARPMRRSREQTARSGMVGCRGSSSLGDLQNWCHPCA